MIAGHYAMLLPVTSFAIISWYCHIAITDYASYAIDIFAARRYCHTYAEAIDIDIADSW